MRCCAATGQANAVTTAKPSATSFLRPICVECIPALRLVRFLTRKEVEPDVEWRRAFAPIAMRISIDTIYYSVVDQCAMVVDRMKRPRLARLELQVLEALWAHGKASIREIQEAFPEPRPAYTTIQTTGYRLEAKGAVRRVRKISNAHIFEPLVARDVARHRLLDDILSLFGGRAQPMMAQLAEAGKLTLDDVRELEKMIKKLQGGKPERGRK